MPTGRLVYLHSENNAVSCPMARRSISSLARHQLPIRTGRKGPSCQSQAPKELLTNLFKDRCDVTADHSRHLVQF
jgi:hypothetical protein